MPYIKQELRPLFDGYIDNLRPETAGELNYIITRITHNFLCNQPLKPGYNELNSAIGVLECAKLELYRRAVAPYEDIKIKENGDV